MKKALSLVLAILVALGCMFAFASCQKKDDTTTTGTTGEEDTGTTEVVVPSTDAAGNEIVDPDGDLQYILDKGTLVVGVTQRRNDAVTF